ncbi:hypothetical protein GTA08_BOTSDO01975 [Botryosphaeria dothidea]|uniref:Carbonic anhydrase n=1 Tax=Botryosphaeria dothidea TaxID=55169 RepID=A0A8H4IZH5_9PEZI|nr:hypothetical protein GTA08_BOTSDO01975 [Botryosphaeria dothidea]
MNEVQFKELVQRNAEYAAKQHVVPGKLENFVAQTPSDFQGLYIITCSDRRLRLSEFLSLRPREANIIRNAGGRVDADVFRSLEIMGTILPIGQIVVIHHSDCGGVYTTDDEVREKLSTRAPAHAHEIKDKVFLTFRHLGTEDSVIEDVEDLGAWPFLPKGAKVSGYVYDLDTGLLKEVAPAKGRE